MTALRFIGTCLGWEPADVSAPGGLSEMIDANQNVTRRTFLRHVDRDSLRAVEASLGYSAHPAQGLTMAGDAHVSYHRSVLHGRRVYFFAWSAIEHVFA